MDDITQMITTLIGSIKDCDYYDWITDYSGDPVNGYAGEYGKPIDRLQMYIVKK